MAQTDQVPAANPIASEIPNTQTLSSTSTRSSSRHALSAEGQFAYNEYLRRTGQDLSIEKPLAPARPGGKIVSDSGLPVTSEGRRSFSNGDYRKGFVRLGPPPPQPENKYHSIHSLEESKKIDALKDTKLNPNLIEDGYDQLAHGLHLWTVVGNKSKSAPNISFDEQKKIASNFYDAIIAPAYGHIYKDSGSAEPLSKELWMKQAFGEALNYKIEDAYTNDWIHSLKHGWNSGLATTARAADRVVTMSGHVFNDVVTQYQKEKLFRQQSDKDRAAILHGQAPASWIERMQQLDNQIDNKYDENIIQRGARWQSDHREFWADTLPSHDGLLNKASSFVAEQAAQAPIFAAISLGNAAAGVAAESTGLTAKLATSPLGRKLTGYLTAGAEGLAYGAATRKQDDPGEVWRDAVGFAVFHGIFDVAGMGLRKLIDIVPAESKLMRDLKKRQDLYVLAQEGKRPATPVEVYDDHKTETANNLMAVGVTGQRAIHVDALQHVEEMESLGDRTRIRQAEKALLENDPARYAPVLSAARFIRSLLGDKKLSELNPQSEEAKHLSTRLAQLIVDSASEMNTRVQGMGEAAEAKAPQALRQPSAKYTLQYYVQKVQEMGGGLVTKEQVQKAAEKLYSADLQKAAEDAEEELSGPKTIKAENIAQRAKDVPATKIRSERTVDKYGQPAVRYSVNPDYKVRLDAHKAAAKSVKQSLTQYFENLSDSDFEHDLSQYFYPKSLNKAGVFFEGQNTREGMQNPNFLAFMYNYLPQMPREFGKELEGRLAETLKVQKYMNGKAPTDPQLLYYAKSMYNHVDNFLGSGRWPQESNLFRTSNEKMFKTTEWQRQLLVEKTVQEQKNLKDMFSGQKNKKALSLALKTHAAFSKLRLNEFDKAAPKRDSQTIIKAYDDVIADLQTVTGTYDKWEF